MGEEANKEQVASPPRKSRAWIWWLVLLVCVLAVLGSAVALVFGWHEPKYSDKPLSYWLAELNGTNYIRREIAADALTKIGEPALEPLKYALRKERSFVFELRDRVWKIAPLAIQQHIPKPWNVDDLQYNACVALAVMGPTAVSVAPELVQAFTNPSPAVISRATYALNKMGTNAHPALLAGLKSADLKVSEQCRTILGLARVPVRASVPLYYDYLLRFLSASSLTEEEIKSALQRFHTSQEEVIKTLRPKLRDGSGEYRTRVAFLLANLFDRSELITRTMMEEMGKLPTAERAACACGLRMQGPHLQPHAERLMKMAEDPAVPVAMQIVLLLEQEFGETKPKWALAERIMAGGNEADMLKMQHMLHASVRSGLEMDKATPYLRQLLGCGHEPVVRSILILLAENPRWSLALIPEVEHYGQGLSTDAQGHKMSAVVANTLRSLKQAQQMMNTPNTPRQNPPAVP